jgi:hypothetical protein
MDRYSAELDISLEDFISSGWNEALDKRERDGYPAMWHGLSTAARAALEGGNQKHAKVLWLLADACSMMLSPASPNEPFKPYAVFHDRRSVVPDDLSDADITFLAEIVDATDDSRLKARIADLVWLKRKPRTVAFALRALDAYRSLPLDTSTWLRGGREAWGRAIGLAFMLKAGAGDRLIQMEGSLIAAISSTTQDDGFLALWLSDLLKSNGLGHERRVDITTKLESLARELDVAGDLHRARQYFSAAAEWARAIPDETKSAEMLVAVAEGWVKEAIARSASASPSHMAAASFYENAIQIYRQTPRAERAAWRVDERIAELRAQLNASGEKALGEMGSVRTPGVDITEVVENARTRVSGKSAQEALLAFAGLHRGANATQLRDNALERMRQFPLQTLLGSTLMSRDGRVIAKRPAMSVGQESTEDDETAIRADMVRDYGILIGIVAQGSIWPALEVLLLEHRICESDFVDLASRSPIVPKERAGLFGKGLFAGYERDFVTALHLLVPQIENMVRVHLKQAAVKTTNLDRNGIENESGLSTLVEVPEMDQVFGKDLAFELRALFCDPTGPNLRNELAHGLLEEGGCQSAYAIYAWWLAFRLTFNTWWNAAQKARADEASAGKAP